MIQAIHEGSREPFAGRIFGAPDPLSFHRPAHPTDCDIDVVRLPPAALFRDERHILPSISPIYAGDEQFVKYLVRLPLPVGQDPGGTLLGSVDCLKLGEQLCKPPKQRSDPIGFRIISSLRSAA